MSEYDTKSFSEKNDVFDKKAESDPSHVNNKIELINSLKSNKIFRDLDDEEFDRLKRVVWRISFKPGEVIAQQGKTGEGIYFILEGKVSVEVRKLGIPKKWIADLSEGSFFGEVSLLTGDPYNATITALEETTCAFIRKDLSDAFGLIYFDTYYKFMTRICESLHRKVKDTINIIHELSREHEPQKPKTLEPITKPIESEFSNKRNYFNKNYHFLNKLDPFAHFSDDDIKLLLSCLEVQFLPKNELLFSEGETGKKCYLVFTGALQTFFRINNHKVKVQVFGPGELVGQFALFSSEGRELSCIAKESTILLSFQGECIKSLKEKNSYVLKKFFDVITESCAIELTTATRQILRLETEIW